MPFADDFSQCLSDAGIPIDANAVPDESVLEAGLANLSDWISSLDAEMQSVLDEITGEFAVNSGIAETNIATELGQLLSAIDEIPATIPISTFLSTAQSCLEQVRQG